MADTDNAATTVSHDPTPAPPPATRRLTLLLIRHGETVYNAEGRLQGHRDIELNAEGQEQAARLAARLRSVWRQPRRLPTALPGPPLAVYASDLRRAVQTAEAVTSALEPPLPIRRMPLLRERGFGEWEGLTEAEIRERYPEARRTPGYEAPGSESYATVDLRMQEALAAIWQECAGFTESGAEPGAAPVVVVVGHGGSLRMLLCRAAGLPVEAARRFHLGNTGLSAIRLRGADARSAEGRVLFVNDTAHLTPAE